MNLDRRARTILVTSAVSREGKSTTIANLAVALARSGRKVALVDLDLRRPFLHRFFHLNAVPGVADVVEKKTKTLAALRSIPLTRQPAKFTSTPPERGNSRQAARQATSSSNGRAHVDGVLRLLPAGTTITDPGEFIGRQELADLVAELGEHFDYVLLDTPPLLAVGDSMALSAMVDAIVAVTRLRFVRGPLLQDFARQLESCQADKLGFVLAGAELEEGYEQSDYYYRYSRPEVERAGRERAKPVE
jgi:Mrp family chromosome partitioning ATPase